MADKPAAEKEKERKRLDVYDYEFITNLELAKNLIDAVQRPRDKMICKKWVNKMCSLNKSNDVTVKRNRNSFFKYFLQILHKGVHGEDDFISRPIDEDRDFTCRWSDDKRTYVAAKPLPGHGTLIYMAVSKDPRLGWEMEGATTYINC